MLSRNQASHIRSLQLPKFRRKYGQFVAEGVKMAKELIHSTYEVEYIYALSSWLEQNEKILSEKKIGYQEISEKELIRISYLTTPNEVMLIVKIPEIISGKTLTDDLTLLLDRIQDPGNLGTIIRTADWFGITTVVCSPDCADIYNPKVVQATMGSITRVSIVVEEPEEFLKSAAVNSTVYGTMSGGEDLYEVPLKTPAVIIIGNESKGISKNILPLVHHLTGIPGRSENLESLNAAIATAIICSEFRRRMR